MKGTVSQNEFSQKEADILNYDSSTRQKKSEKDLQKEWLNL
jgi:hypothetical protein